MNMLGYETITTFWEDFSIAEKFGYSAVKETFDRVFKEWKDDYKYLTELVMVMNWKSWYWCDKDVGLSDVYADLYYKADDYALDNLKGEEFDYYFHVTD